MKTTIEWIDVNDRLPEVHTTRVSRQYGFGTISTLLLVACRDIPRVAFGMYCCDRGKKNWVGNNWLYIQDVTHWAELPQAPGEKEE